MARPSVPLLDQDKIRDAALALIDTQGLEKLSMRNLAKSLGVQAASLYSHYPNKGAVMDAVANVIARKVDTSGFDLGWEEGLRIWANSYRGAILQHPNAAPIVAAGVRERSDFLAMADAVHGGLLRHDWPPRYATMIAAAVKYLVLGAASTSFGGGFPNDAQVYLDRYPNLVEAHRLHAHAESIDRGSFELAVTALITGFEPVYERVKLSQHEPADAIVRHPGS